MPHLLQPDEPQTEGQDGDEAAQQPQPEGQDRDEAAQHPQENEEERIEPEQTNPGDDSDLGNMADSASAIANCWNADDSDFDIVLPSDNEGSGNELNLLSRRSIAKHMPAPEPESQSESDSKSKSESESEEESAKRLSRREAPRRTPGKKPERSPSSSSSEPEQESAKRLSRREAPRRTPGKKPERSPSSSSSEPEQSPERNGAENSSSTERPTASLACEKEKKKKKCQGAKVTGDATTCLLCRKTFTKIWNASRHLEQKHNLDKNDAGFKSNLAIGQERTRACPFCAKHFTKISRHIAMCKEKKRKEEREKRKEESEKRKEKKSNNCDVGQPSADNIEAEGDLVMMDQRTKFPWKRTQAGAALGPMLAQYMASKDMAMATRMLYMRKLKEMLSFFEDNVPDFIANNLLKPVELHSRLPNLGSFLASKDSKSSRASACSAYLTLARAHYDYCEDLYGNSKTLKESDLAHLLLTINQKITSASNRMKTASVSAKKDTATKKFAQRREDLTDLKQNPDLMGRIVKDIGTSRLLRNLEKRLLKDYKEESSKREVGESSVRHLILVNLLAHGAGQRPSAFTRMTIKEFLNAKHNNGMLEVVVADHKTKGVYKCQIPILRKPVEQLMRLYLTHSRG